MLRFGLIAGVIVADIASATLDLPQLVDIVTTLGTTGLLTVWLWMMITRRLVTFGELEEANGRTEKAEAQRDEAMAGWRGQTAATNELTAANSAVLDFVKSSLIGRRTR